MTLWQVEEIRDTDSLFYRVPVGSLRPGDMQVHPGVFKENKGSMSADWEKYSSAHDTRARQGRPERFAIIRMNVGHIREIEGLKVLHEPVQNVVGKPDNRAHSAVYGIEGGDKTELGRKEKIRTELLQKFNAWEIAPGAPIDQLTERLASDL
jgi:hypothetical protein